MHTALTLAASLLLLPSALAAGLYSKDSGVLNIDQRTYRTLIERANHTSIVEFYAPWCGHCKALQPHYERAAKQLHGLAQVAAVNCDAEENKAFCGQMGVQGFPTLKIVKPARVKDGKKGRPMLEDYQGPREAKAIVNAVIEKIPNHVKRLKDSDYQSWLEEHAGPKAILFSNKASVSALLKAIAVDFLGAIDIAQIRDKETAAVANFNIEKFPTLLLLPGLGRDPIPYTDDMKKDNMLAFLSQAAPPNPAPEASSPKKPKASSTKKDKAKASKAKSDSSKASTSHAPAEAKTDKASQTDEKLEDSSPPTESPGPHVDELAQKPITVPDLAPPLTLLNEHLTLQRKCLNSKAGTCILALPPDPSTDNVLTAISGLQQIHHKHDKSGRNLFPFYQVDPSVTQTAELRSTLKLGDDVEVIAVNGKRGWVRHFSGPSFEQSALEDWIDAIRMGDLPKQPLPDSLIVPADSLPAEPKPANLDFEDYEDPKKLKESLKANLPEGLQLEMEEMDDELFASLVDHAKKRAARLEKKTAAEEAQGGDVKEEDGPDEGAHDEL